ncbi:MAG TPA: hypothetical protein VF475_09205 [Sphingobium sp.]
MILSTCLDVAADVAGPELMARLHADLSAYKAAGADLLLLGTQSDGGVVPGRLDALIGAPALASAAGGTPLVAVLPALFSLPFHVARALSAADFLSGGTMGWMPTVATRQDRAPGYGAAYAVSADEAPAKALDMIRATQALWDSWDEDALVLDKAAGRYLDTARVRRVDYRGTHFDVMGPLNAARPPQGYPVLIADEADPLFTAEGFAPELLLIGRDDAATLAQAVADLRAKGFTGRILAKLSPDGAPGCCPVADAAAITDVDGFHIVAADAAQALATLRAHYPADEQDGPLRARLSLPTPTNPFSASRSVAA